MIHCRLVRYPPHERIDKASNNQRSNYRHRGRAWQPSPTQKIGNPQSRRNPKQLRLPVQADTAVRPYAEIIVAIKVKSTKPAPNAMRGGMLSARAGRRKWCHHRQSCQCVPATSARMRGTHRASALLKRQTVRDRITDTAGGRGSPPLHRKSDIRLACTIHNNIAFLCGRTRRSATTQRICR